MRRAIATVLLLVMADAATGQTADTAFAPTLPHGIVDVSEWQVVSGDFDSAGMRGAYLFYVNPARQAMYQLMRYRVELLGQAARESRRGSAERVAFVRRPGAREPLLLWVRSGEAVEPSWRAVGTDTDEYRIEIGVLMAVLGVHRAARAAPDP
jgi:hypothetical protein